MFVRANACLNISCMIHEVALVNISVMSVIACIIWIRLEIYVDVFRALVLAALNSEMVIKSWIYR